jgi:hypothetical protein
MSNIISMSLCKISDNAKLEYNQDKGAEKTFKLYSAMADILCESCETFVKGDWEFQIIENDVSCYQEIFHKNFQEVHDMWNEDGPNNILFLDLDTFVIGEVDVFDKLHEFQMFNYTDPKQLSGNDKNNKYGLDHEHYFNAGVRYYPSAMWNDVWDLGWSYAQDWDYDIWGTEQIIFNEMMFSQNNDVAHWHKPEMNFQMMNVSPAALNHAGFMESMNSWNGCKFDDAKILHLHGTRNAEQTLLTQWSLWKNITGEEFEFENFDVVDVGNNLVLVEK